MTRRWLSLALPVLLGLAVGCRGEPTQVVVIVDAQHGVREQAQSVSVEIRGGDRGTAVPETIVHSVTETMAYEDWPIRFVLGPENGDASRVYRVEAVARRGVGMSSPALVTGRVISSYNEGRTLQIYLLLEDLCIGVRCDDPGQTCLGGACAGAFREPEPYTDGAVPDAGLPTGCVADADCDDEVPCTVDRCSRGFCLHTADDSVCVDEHDCTRGVCTGVGCRQEPVDEMCNDGVPCTRDVCSPSEGCTAEPADDRCTAAPGGTCDPENGCQYPDCVVGTTCVVEDLCQLEATCEGDTCVRPSRCAGACCGGMCTDCSDDNPCTADVCMDGACANPPIMGTCDDGDPCTSGDFCSEGTCRAGGVGCDDGNPCTADMCGASGCESSPVVDGTPCNDGDACRGDTCRAGVCRANTCGMDAGVDSGVDSGFDSGFDSGACGGGELFCSDSFGGGVCCPTAVPCCDGVCCGADETCNVGFCEPIDAGVDGGDGGGCASLGGFCVDGVDCCSGCCEVGSCIEPDGGLCTGTGAP